MSTGWDDTERAALVALLRTRPRGMTWPQITAEVDRRGSAMELWRAQHPADLFESYGESLALAEARRDIAGWLAADLGFMTFLDDVYPAQLRDIHDLPPVLFHRGALAPGEAGISVVGSRAASPRGLSIARSIAAGLVERGVVVIAGLARGIDTAAHRAALDAGGRTVAVIGTGLNRYYPAENRSLQDLISRDGMVLSQFWPDSPPTRHTFPMRNIVMSGYGRATIVVEATEQSGARIQAKRAVAHGRPVILTDRVVAVNRWPCTLIGRPGVHVASSTAEVMKIAESILDQPAAIDKLFSVAAEG
jgi:DNA protecting protein DprA